MELNNLIILLDTFHYLPYLIILISRAVTESINTLVDVCTSAAPGQKDCDNTVRNMESMRPLLDNVSHPVSTKSYFECLDTVMESSKALGKIFN
jgi:talin